MQLVTPAQMRAMDRATIDEVQIPGIILMEHAALGAISVLDEHLQLDESNPPSIGILCGGGNNGGDGFAMARLLHQRGHEVFVGLLSSPERISGDAQINYLALEGLGIVVTHLDIAFDEADAWHQLPYCDVWCDAIFGTGLDREVTGHYASAIHFLNQQDNVLAVDIASGLDAQTGQVLGCAVRATATASFGLPKLGQVIAPGRGHSGTIHVVDIGLPPHVIREVGVDGRWLTPSWAKAALKTQGPDAHKGTAGRVLVVAGHHEMSGAAMLTARAVIEAGAGLVTVGTAEEVVSRIALSTPEVMAFDAFNHEHLLQHGQRADCIAVGPGLGQGDQAAQWLKLVLTQTSAPLVLDADALNLLADNDALLGALVDTATTRPVILTPHPGEMARLAGCSTPEVLAAPRQTAQGFAQESGCVVVLKLSTTLVISDLGELSVNQTGNPGMATAGMGDTLTGIIAAMLPQYDDHYEAVSLAVCLHGMAGDLARDRHGVHGTTASRTIDALSTIFRTLETQ